MTENITRRIPCVLEAYSTMEARMNEVHDDKYDYTDSVFTRLRDEMSIKCPTHGTFRQRPSDHLDGRGCPVCSKSYSPSTEEWIMKAKTVHGDKYDYTKTEYTHSKEKLTITCRKHGDFETRPTSHIDGCDCPKCALENSSFNRSTYRKQLTYLYVMLVNNKYYKIGITRRTPEKRLKQAYSENIKVLASWKFTDGTLAYDIEKEALRQTYDYKYKGPPIMKTGNTELRTSNPIQTIQKIITPDMLMMTADDAANL